MNVVKTTIGSVKKPATETAFQKSRLADKKVRIQAVLVNELTELRRMLEEHKENLGRYETWVDEEQEKIRSCQDRIDNISDLLEN
jgi:hypothetical protein